MNTSAAREFAPTSRRSSSAGFEAPSGRGFIALLEAFRATGGTAPSEIVRRLLEEYQLGELVSLARLLRTGQIFGFEWRAGLWIPMFQFDAEDLALKTGARKVRAELPALWSGWILASWFAAPNERLDGRCPADTLGTDLDAVMLAAQAAGRLHGAIEGDHLALVGSGHAPEYRSEYRPPVRTGHDFAQLTAAI